MKAIVSVVVPCYNRAKSCARAVRSVLCQTYSGIEIIVVDDASDDGDELAGALSKIGDARIRLIRHDVNQGGAAARNSGVAAAAGEFIAFLDSDDEWMPSKLEKQLARAEALGNSDWLIYCQSEVITTQSSGLQKSIMPLRSIERKQAVGDYLFAGRGWIPTPAMFLPRRIASKVLFNPALRRHQDYDLLLRLEAEGCRFEMIPEPLVVVHWEDLHQTARGLNPAQSLAFLKEYQVFLSPKARAGFVSGQIVMRLFDSGRKLAALCYCFMYVRPWHLSLVQHLNLFSMLLFGDVRITKTLADLKRFRGGL